MLDAVPVDVHDHGFLIGDAFADTPYHEMEYSTGMGGLMTSAILICAGVDRGTVSVSATIGPPLSLDTPKQWDHTSEWDDIAEVSLYAPRGALTVEQLSYGPHDSRPALPVLTPNGPGHYRIRLHATGRDRHHDQVKVKSGERFHLHVWPASPTPPLIIKATSRCGFGLRRNAHATTSPPRPRGSMPT